MPGTKKLSVPSISSSFKWNGPEVLSICSQGALYIMANRLPLSWPNGEDEDVFDQMPDLPEAKVDCSGVNQRVLASDDHAEDFGDRRSGSTNMTSYASILVAPVERDQDSLPTIVSDSDEEFDKGPEESSQLRNDTVQLRDVLLTLSQRVVDTATTSYINVRRHHIWEDSARILRRKRFDPRSIISVKFADDDGTSEGAVDLGDPRREFLRLLLQASNLQSGVFQGPEDRRVLFANSLAREKDYYRLVGMMIAWSVIHGGPGGNFLSKTLYNALAYGIENVSADPRDLPSSTMQEKIALIENASSLHSLNSALEDESIQSVLVAQGAKPSSSSLEEKGKFVKLITNFLLLDSTRYVFEDFQKGMHTMGLLDCIKEHPRLFEEIFCAQEQPLDANMVDLLFRIEYAEEGTRAREKQERAVVFWRDYLQDCGGIKYLTFEVVNFISVIFIFGIQFY